MEFLSKKEEKEKSLLWSELLLTLFFRNKRSRYLKCTPKRGKKKNKKNIRFFLAWGRKFQLLGLYILQRTEIVPLGGSGERVKGEGTISERSENQNGKGGKILKPASPQSISILLTQGQIL